MKRVPFDVEKCKNGATVRNHLCELIRIVCYNSDVSNQPLLDSFGRSYCLNGKFKYNESPHDHDLFIEEEIKYGKWSINEALVGCLLRFKTNKPKTRFVMVSIGVEYVYYINDAGFVVEVSYERLLKYYEHSCDFGHSWLPCGKAL